MTTFHIEKAPKYNGLKNPHCNLVKAIIKAAKPKEVDKSLDKLFGKRPKVEYPYYAY